MGNTCLCDCILNSKTNALELYRLQGRFRCKVVDVYDGDTVSVVLYNKFGYEKHKLRMYGYDSPEMKPRKNIANRDEEKAAALAAKAFLADLVLDKVVIFDSMGTDKYGRLLGKLYTLGPIYCCCSEAEVNQLMLDSGHGYAYTGGTKREHQLLPADDADSNNQA